MLMVAIAIGTGVGANALVSKSLGQGDREKASKSAGNAMFMGIVIYAVFLIFGLFGTDIYISSQTSNPLIADMANDYLSLCCIVSPGIVFFAVFEKLLQSAGIPGNGGKGCCCGDCCRTVCFIPACTCVPP